MDARPISHATDAAPALARAWTPRARTIGVSALALLALLTVACALAPDERAASEPGGGLRVTAPKVTAGALPTQADPRASQRDAAAEPAFAALPGSDLRGMRSCLGPGESAPERLAALASADRRHVLRVAYGYAFMDALPDAAGSVVLWRDLILWVRERAGLTPMLTRASRSRVLDTAWADLDVGNWTKVVRAVPDMTGDGLPEACVLAWDGPGSVGRGLKLRTWRLRLQLLDVACADVLWESDALSWMDPESWGVLDMQRFVDLDGDGAQDLLVAMASQPGGELRLAAMSARDGRLLGESRVTWDGAWAPDLGAPTEPLLVLRSRLAGTPGAVPPVLVNCGQGLLLLEFDARSGTADVRHSFVGDARFSRTSRMVELGDIDGDGVADIAWSSAGEPYSRWFYEHNNAPPRDGILHLDAQDAVLAPRHHGAVALLSGRELTELDVWTGTGMGEGFGHGLARYPDVDGDGLDDLLVSSHSEGPITDSGLRVRLLSTATGRVLGSWPSPGTWWPPFPPPSGPDPASPWLEGLGWDLAVVPDEDGDGFPEVLVSIARHAGFEGGMFDIECPESAVIWLSSRALVAGAAPPVVPPAAPGMR